MAVAAERPKPEVVSDTGMKFTETKLTGAFLIELEKKSDDRGFFARAWCAEEFAAHGLNCRIAQCNNGFSDRASTLRGIHFQVAPHAETKVVRCIHGALYDVIVDLRPRSPTFREWCSHELSADNRRMLYIPEGFGHGYQTLEDNTEILYLTSEFYHPESASGVCYDDPALGIDWPLDVTSISLPDRNWPAFDAGTDSPSGPSLPGGAP